MLPIPYIIREKGEENMKKKVSVFLAISSILSLGSLVACGNNGGNNSSGGNNTSVVDADDEYVIKFNNNYDGSVTKVVVKAGEQVTLPEAPTRPGYNFVGWYLSYKADSTEEFDPSKPVYEDMTVFAKWAENISERIVTLHYNDGVTKDETVIVNNGEKLGEPTTPVYPDGTKAFTGWYLDKECTEKYDFSKKVESSFDLYAGWKQSKATVTFNYNYVGSEEAERVTVDLDKPMDKPTDPTREHYAFTGWYDRAVGGNPIDFSQPIAGDATYYAHWEQSEFLVTFDLNGGANSSKELSTYIVKGGSAIDFASNLEAGTSYVGHDFTGWYLEKFDANADEDATAGKTKANIAEINAAVTVYAGWRLSTYTVTFDLGNAEATGLPATQSVKYGKLLSAVEAPTLSGYLFLGWYTDEALTQQFTFDTPVTSNLTLRAKWIEDPGAVSNVKITYHANGAIYDEKEYEFNTTAASNMPGDPTKTDAKFAGWYTDEACTTKFNPSANLTEDIHVYAKFLKKYRFEAESIDFTDKHGQGTSTNSFEEAMIMSGAYVADHNVSNGFFVRELYYNGAALDFEITSDVEVFDAIMYLRVSSESYEFMTTDTYNGKTYNYLSDQEFKIIINGDWDGDEPVEGCELKYGGLHMPMANLINREDLADEKTPFEDMFIAENIHLNAGVNLITLYVNNVNNHGGTFHAEAPIIDCMDIYSSSTLTATDYEFYTRPNVNL